MNLDFKPIQSIMDGLPESVREAPMRSNDLTLTWRESVLDIAKGDRDKVVVRSIWLNSTIRRIESEIRSLSIDTRPFDLQELTREVVEAWGSIGEYMMPGDLNVSIPFNTIYPMEDIYNKLLGAKESQAEVAKLLRAQSDLTNHLNIVDYALSLSLSGDLTMTSLWPDTELFPNIKPKSKIMINTVCKIVLDKSGHILALLHGGQEGASKPPPQISLTRRHSSLDDRATASR